MAEEREQKSCRYEDNTYADGSEFCIDDYCFRCSDGELHAYAGAFPG